MIKAVIFDVGGVLIRTVDHNYRRKWEKQLGLAKGESEEIVFNSDMGLRAQRGMAIIHFRPSVDIPAELAKLDVDPINAREM